ncbi:MAG: outer membrane beta-barrel protein [Bacteroidales bacterium]|nr:outer membrane beta-barrel protein [Bacteroidales bacterium]
MKKTISLLFAVALLATTAMAQEQEHNSNPWGFNVEFDLGLSAIGGFGNSTDHFAATLPQIDYKQHPTAFAHIGLSDVINYKRFQIGLNIAWSTGGIYSYANQYIERNDYHVWLDLGYNFKLSKTLSLNPMVGFGTATSTSYVASGRSGSDYVGSFTSNNLAVPLTLKLWYNYDDLAIGFFVRYTLFPTQIGETTITGLESKVDGLRIEPAALTAGIAFCF